MKLKENETTDDFDGAGILYDLHKLRDMQRESASSRILDKMSDIATLSGDEIRDLFQKKWPGASIFVMDEIYSLPSKHWIETTFSDFVKPRIGEWIPEEDDCDDSGEDIRFYARKLHERTPKETHSAIAVGFFLYIRELEQDMHCKSIILCEENGEYEVLIYEGRNQTLGSLTEEENNKLLMIFI